MTTGLITHIQRFSLHDGPGIRTVVFLKGCQLRCAWCHNPETLSPKPEIQTYPGRCIGCLACVDVCEHNARRTIENRIRFDRAQCAGCGRCAEECFSDAIVLTGETWTAEAVVAEAGADKHFYADSGGGLTISGGEPFFQSKFTLEILRLARETGLPTAVETNLAWPQDRIAEALPYLDLIMADLKLIDDEKHRRWTGVSNTDVLANLAFLGREGIPLIVRTPVVAEINDSCEELRATAEFLAGIPSLCYYELLPYHPLGEAKRESLGLNVTEHEFTAPKESRMQELADVAAEQGIEVHVGGGMEYRTTTAVEDKDQII